MMQTSYWCVPWEIVVLDEVEQWYLELAKCDQRTAELVTAAIDKLADEGPFLGRPLVDRIKGSRLHNLKELRPGSSASSEVRVLFIFDPDRQAVLLVAGDKSGAWSRWYREHVPLAEARYERWLVGGYDDDRK